MSSSFSRRQFLITSCLAAMAGSSGCAFTPVEKKTSKGKLVFAAFNCPEGTFYKKSLKDDGISSSAFLIDLDSNDMTEIHDTVAAHSIERIPGTDMSLAVEKKGRCFSIIDWETEKETARFFAHDGERFGGHCAFSEDGKTAIISGNVPSSNSGMAYILDIKSGKFERIPLERPMHDIVRINQDEFLIASQTGDRETSILNTFDLKTGKIEKYETGENHFWFTHLTRPEDGKVFGIANLLSDGKYNSGRIFEFNLKDRKFSEAIGQNDKILSNELLSHVYDQENQRLWVSVPGEQKLVVWDVKKNQVQKIFDLKFPTSVSLTLDKKSVVVGSAGKFHIFDCAKMTEVPASFPKFPMSMVFARHTRVY